MVSASHCTKDADAPQLVEPKTIVVCYQKNLTEFTTTTINAYIPKDNPWAFQNHLITWKHRKERLSKRRTNSRNYHGKCATGIQ